MHLEEDRRASEFKKTGVQEDRLSRIGRRRLIEGRFRSRPIGILYVQTEPGHDDEQSKKMANPAGIVSPRSNKCLID